MAGSEIAEPNLFKAPVTKEAKPRKRKLFHLIFIVLIAFFVVRTILGKTSIEVPGRVHAQKELEIKTLVPGILKGLYVENTQKVKNGDVLFEFKNDKLGIDLVQAMHEKETSEQELKRLEQAMKHSVAALQSGKVLVENGVIGKLKFEEMELEHLKTQNFLEQKKRELEAFSLKVKELQAEKDSLRVLAPFDGIFLGDPSRKVGTYFNKGKALGVLFQTEKFYLEASLPERQAARVKVGDSAQVTFAAFKGSFTGTVSQIDEKAIDEVEKVFKLKHVIRARISLDSTPEGLKPGMRGNARIF